MAATSTHRAAARAPSARNRVAQTYRNLTLWTFQGWIAMFFIAAGYAKLTESLDNLITLMGWPALVPEPFVRGLGIAEIILALGMLAPLVSWRMGRPLLMVAAFGLAVLEVVMLGVHALGGDIGLSIVNLILLGLTVPVLWGRRA
jgi:hypothetical protein